MTRWEAPGKLNLSLLISPPRADGYHPLQSLVQTIEWCDHLDFEEVEERDDLIVIEHPDIDPEDNLVSRALRHVRSVKDFPKQRVVVDKVLPTGAGVGGGSSNAAATLMAAAGIAGLGRADVAPLAVTLGADVPLFLTGGTLHMGGIGEVIAPQQPLTGVAFAVAVPEFRLDTREVYREWDRLEGPQGETLPEGALPPALRDGMPIRNDLTPAAMSVEPQLAEFMAELRSRWGQPVLITGSGSGCFGMFPGLDEAVDAAGAVSDLCRVSVGVEPRPRGVAEVFVDQGR